MNLTSLFINQGTVCLKGDSRRSIDATFLLHVREYFWFLSKLPIYAYFHTVRNFPKMKTTKNNFLLKFKSLPLL